MSDEVTSTCLEIRGRWAEPSAELHSCQVPSLGDPSYKEVAPKRGPKNNRHLYIEPLFTEHMHCLKTSQASTTTMMTMISGRPDVLGFLNTEA